jgi:ATP synthase protein I
VVLVMGTGLVVLQKTAKSLPQLFQMMGLLLYTTQILFVLVFLIVFKDTTLFDTKAFAFTLLGTTLTWIAAQTRGHMKAKILYVDPDSADAKKAETAGSPT